MPDLPYVPDSITVHLGAPDDPSAYNVTVPFLDYLKNVASSEIYPTWPESAIRANVYAQMTFALNRIYTEWYRSQGYDFDITNNTAYDQAFVYGRDIFDNIGTIVEELFSQYLARPDSIAPLFSAYCDGRRVTCEGLSQWGTVDLAQSGLTPYEILTNYYGSDLDIRTAPTQPFQVSYPGTPVRLGEVSNAVRTIQVRLNRISDNFPAIPKIYPVNSIYDLDTQKSVRAFQEIFGLTPDGIVGPATWYKITSVYNAVKRLGELDAESITPEEIAREYEEALSYGSVGIQVRVVQYFLSVIGSYYPALPVIEVDGIFGQETLNAVQAYQQAFGLPVNGVVDRQTWESIVQTYQGIVQNDNTWMNMDIPLFPGQNLVLGSQSPGVLQVQQWINILATAYPQVTPVPETGYYGEMTRNAVIAIQELLGLTPLGVVSTITWNALAREAMAVQQNAAASQ